MVNRLNNILTFEIMIESIFLTLVIRQLNYYNQNAMSHSKDLTLLFEYPMVIQ